MSLGHNDANLARLRHRSRSGSIAFPAIVIALIAIVTLWLAAPAVVQFWHDVATYDNAQCGTECAAYAEKGMIR